MPISADGRGILPTPMDFLDGWMMYSSQRPSNLVGISIPRRRISRCAFLILSHLGKSPRICERAWRILTNPWTRSGTRTNAPYWLLSRFLYRCFPTDSSLNEGNYDAEVRARGSYFHRHPPAGQFLYFPPPLGFRYGHSRIAGHSG